MSKVYVQDIREKDRVESVFKLTRKAVAAGKSGKPFLTLVFGDKTGEIDGRVWENIDAMEALAAVGELVKVTALTVAHFGQPQLKVEAMTKAERGDLPEEDFVVPPPKEPAPSLTPADAGNSSSGRRFAELGGLVDKVHDPHIRALLRSFLDDPELAPLLKRAPAAKTIHHAYAGGLLDHTLSCVKLAHRLCDHYPQADRDLVVAGAFLHDIGKTKELSFDRKVEYSDEGRLVGHLVMTAQWIHERAKTIPGFSPQLEQHLTHLVLSHHGSLEYGSPKLPSTIEALLVHHLDEIDSRMSSWLSVMGQDAGDTWTDYNKTYDRHLYKGPAPTSAGKRPVESRGPKKRHKVPSAPSEETSATPAPSTPREARESRDPAPREPREPRGERPDRPPRPDKRPPAQKEVALTFKPFAAIAAAAEPESEPGSESKAGAKPASAPEAAPASPPANGATTPESGAS